MIKRSGRRVEEFERETLWGVVETGVVEGEEADVVDRMVCRFGE